MDLNWKIELIDDLIRENPETTIQDYLDIVADLEQIEQQKTEDMGSYSNTGFLSVMKKYAV